MQITKEQKLIQEFEKYIQSNDIESIYNHLPKFLKTYQKLSRRMGRMDRILNQTDKQQFDMLKLKEKVEDRNNKINLLLNSIGQGFLSFDQNMKIESEYSKEAYILLNQDIYNKNIVQILYPDDKQKQEFIEQTLKNILGQDFAKQEILLSLLDNEFFINNRYLNVEYKVLDDKHFMMIITDITETKQMAKKVQQEQQILKMAVNVVTSTDQFLEIKNDFTTLCNKIDDFKTLNTIKSLQREIHTFKGLFAQKDLIFIVEKLHDFESYIQKSIKNNKIEPYIIELTSNEILSWLDQDIEILKDILGEDFFTHGNYMSIKKDRLSKLYDDVATYIKTKNDTMLDTIQTEVQQLQYHCIDIYFNPYKTMIVDLANRLDKLINPPIFDIQEIYLSDKYKLFFNSLVHIFRNGIDHGIEDIETRYELDKPLEATISCKVFQEDDTLKIIIEDDGCGIDIQNIKQKAIEKEIYSSKVIELLSEDDILMTIFHDNFSTRETISDISGRGVGLASVLEELKKLNGFIKIENRFQYGLKFIFSLPLSSDHKGSEYDFLNKLVKKTIEYLKNDLAIDINTNYDITTSTSIECQELNSYITLSKDMNSTIFINTSKKLALNLIEQFISADYDKETLSLLKIENLSELLNIVVGNILQDLDIIKNGGKVDISTPVILNKDECLDKFKNKQVFQAKLKLDNDNIILSLVI